jgi:predicted DNA-binding transcriptional regulator AlpA
MSWHLRALLLWPPLRVAVAAHHPMALRAAAFWPFWPQSVSIKLRGAIMGKDQRSEHPPRIEVAPRRGLRRAEAARYIGIGPTKFDGLVREGVMPNPWRIGGCVVWDIRKLDAALDSLIDEGKANEWD